MIISSETFWIAGGKFRDIFFCSIRMKVESTRDNEVLVLSCSKNKSFDKENFTELDFVLMNKSLFYSN